MASSECNDTAANSGETQPQHTRLPQRLPPPGSVTLALPAFFRSL